MTRPRKVKVSPSELSSLVEHVSSTFFGIIGSYTEIDQGLEELKEFWAGDNRESFYSDVQSAQNYKMTAAKNFNNFCNDTLRSIPVSYSKLNAEIEKRAKELLSRNDTT